ncbi:MAG: TetR family transcriptional regulator [Parcubacteria group bacterium]|nr:TetR family transcriptional regulator [Parcubacteria group bacterium]
MEVAQETVRQPTARAISKMKTKEGVLRAARELFSTQEYESVTTRGVAEKAGMSTGAMFANFENKADLFAAVLGQAVEERRKLIEISMEEAEDSAEEALLAIFSAAYTFHYEQRTLSSSLMAALWMRYPDEVLARATSEMRKQDSLFIHQALWKGAEKGKFHAKLALDMDLVADTLHALLLSQQFLCMAGHTLAIHKVHAQIKLVLGTLSK